MRRPPLGMILSALALAGAAAPAPRAPKPIDDELAQPDRPTGPGFTLGKHPFRPKPNPARADKQKRHKRRMALRNPRRLWERQCAKCTKPITTSYAPDRSEIVFCETCYLETVY